MPLQKFLAAVAKAAQDFAPQYGLDPKELQLAMITAAGLEGGLGEEAAVGDGGASVGRFQFQTVNGHGRSLLDQGYTRDQIADDEFQAQDFAPEIASKLAAVKKAGMSGGEAIRQAIFAAERPAEIYNADRFNGVISGAANLMGGAPPPSSGVGGTAVPGSNSDIDTIRKALQKRVSDALTKYNGSGAQADYTELQKALFDLGTFEDAIPNYQSSKDPAQQAFDNSIKLGDLNLRISDSAYQRWSDKNNLARAAATAQVNDAESKNKTNEAIAASYFQRNGQGPKPLTETYMAPTFDTALANWRDKFGAGSAQMPANYTGASVPTPGSGQETPAATTTDTSTPAAGSWGNQNGSDRAAFVDADLGIDAPYRAMSQFVDNPHKQGTSFGDLGSAVKRFTNEGLVSAANPVAGAGGAAIGMAGGMGGVAKKAKKWWNALGGASGYKFGIPGYAKGTGNHPGGPAIVNERGPETAIIPGFGGPVQFQGGAQMQNLPPGTAVIPSDVPPDEAFAYAQIQRALQQPQGDPQTSPEAQQARANDPQLQQKVMDSLRKAMAANAAVNPPMTPVLTGKWDHDPWQDLRQLTGVPANGDPAAMGMKGGA